MGNPACVQCQPSGVLHRGLRARQEIAFFDPNTGIGAVIACMSGNTSFDFQVFSREWSKREIIPTNEHCCGLNDCSQLRNKCVLSRIGLFSLTCSPSLFFDATSTSLFSLSSAVHFRNSRRHCAPLCRLLTASNLPLFNGWLQQATGHCCRFCWRGLQEHPNVMQRLQMKSRRRQGRL